MYASDVLTANDAWPMLWRPMLWSGCGGPARCNDYLHGSWFVHNLLNMAEQLDVSWTGWAWRGTHANGGQCAEPPGQTECGYPDMREKATHLVRTLARPSASGPYQHCARAPSASRRRRERPDDEWQRRRRQLA